MSGTKVSGALFKNAKKKTQKHPDYLGVMNISREFARKLAEKFRDSKDDEIKVQVSGWWKEPKDPKKSEYISLSGDFGLEGAGERGRERDDRGPPRGRDDRDRARDDRPRDDRGRDDRGRDDGKRNTDFDDEIPF